MKNYGQTIVEIVVVIGIVLLLLTALIAGSTVALKSGSYGKQKSLSVKYAEEAMENIRNERNSDWTTFFARAGSTYCLKKDNTFEPTPGVCDVGNYIDSVYARNVTYEWIAGPPAKMQVDVTVSWIDGNKTYQSTLRSYFTQWQQ